MTGIHIRICEWVEEVEKEEPRRRRRSSPALLLLLILKERAKEKASNRIESLLQLRS